MEENRLKCTFLNLVTKKDAPLLASGLIATLGLHIISMDMFLSKCKLIRKKDGTCYVAPPSEKYKDPQTGKDIYANYFWFGEKTSDFFQKEAIKAIKTYCQGKGMADPTLLQSEAKEPPSSTFVNQYYGSNETQSTFKTVESITDPFNY